MLCSVLAQCPVMKNHLHGEKKEKKNKAGFEPQPYKHEASYINVIAM